MEGIGENLWIQRHPLSLIGCKLGRNVTVIRLPTGKLVIHSTANFSSQDIEDIESKGEPGWLVEATNFHDTCASRGRQVFPDLPYLTPAGFRHAETDPILPAPPEWEGELKVLEVAGMPRVREHVFFHANSKTLIVADLFFNLPRESGRWTLGFMRAMSGIKTYPDSSRFFRSFIRDREAFYESLRKMLEWDFKKVIVGHGEPLTGPDVRERVLAALRKTGFSV
ncbi:MAG: hypothetical protein HKN23_00500 [Verrucomicrobiales bacterium]|nr:hypothetical protein [Verrucomicrobiales bacterium]